MGLDHVMVGVQCASFDSSLDDDDQSISIDCCRMAKDYLFGNIGICC